MQISVKFSFEALYSSHPVPHVTSTTNLESSEESLCIPGKVKPYANVGSTLKKTLGDGGLLRRTKIERGKEESFSAS